MLFEGTERPSVEEVKQAINGRQNTMVFSCTENGKYNLLEEIDRPFIYIVPDILEARRATRIIKEYTGKEVVLIPEREDPLRCGQVSSDTRKERVNCLYKLATNEAFGAVVTAEGAMQYFPKKENFLSAVFTIKKDEEMSFEELANKLVSIGYKRTDEVLSTGNFSFHGDRFEIFIIGRDLPTRISFFGDTVEEIKEFALDTKVSVRSLDKVVILPMNDTLVSQNIINRIRNSFVSRMRVAKKEEYQLIEKSIEMLDDLPYFLTPFCLDEMSFLDDYLCDPIIVYSDVKAIENELKSLYSLFETRVKNYIVSSECFREHIKIVPSPETIYESFSDRTKLGFNLLTSHQSAFVPNEIFNVKSLSIDRYYLNKESFLYDLKNWSFRRFTGIISTFNEYSARTLQDELLGQGIKLSISNEAVKEQIVISPQFISSGFVFPEEKIVLVGAEDLFGKMRVFEKREDYKKEVKIAPKKGDYVVHERFGIGLSEGINSVKTPYGYKDYYVILYKDGDRLYVPPDQMDEIERWSGSGKPTIHRLSSKEFDKIKERVKESAKNMAIDLLTLYEKRERTRGFVYSQDTEFQKELEDSFPFEETADQLRAVNEIKEDMESGKIMDRLLAGDVGFGKTEVALRAMFKTIFDGKQAAMLCPTTILCEQHYNTIKERLQPFGINIAVLSRLQEPKVIKKNIEDIASGKVQIIVATHRLLSSDVAFHDLGLLVLDEEQRFGVEDKEKIKALKTNVNVLTMSATPIPRTLHMALSGIRDISLLTEPPKNRIPVKTYVTEYTDTLVVDAVRKEIARDGQVFILFNDVRRIEEYTAHLQDLMQDVPIIFAHGQMSPKEMDERITLFYNKKARVLVATTIIENGVDVPSANTIIVKNADRIGLASLYQLKGRVGRSDISAYAYFTVDNSVLSDSAIKRLTAIVECSDLGSGFKIAERDLEIRGAGNVLGREQHGNMEKVGYDMYVRLIREAVDELKGIEKEKVFDVEIKTEGEECVPETYMKKEEDRVECMKRARAVRDKEERLAYLEELKDAYGKVPDSVLNLVDLGEIKNIAKKLGMKTVSIGKNTFITLYDIGAVERGRLLESLSSFVNIVALSVRKEPVIEFKIERMKYREKLVCVRRFLETAL